MMFKQNEQGDSPFSRTVSLSRKSAASPGQPQLPEAEERFGVFNVGEIAVCDGSTVQGRNPVTVTTSTAQWAYAALVPIRDDEEQPLADGGPLLVRVEAFVEQGEVGISVAAPHLREFIAPEVCTAAGKGLTSVTVTVSSPVVGCWLVIRNCAPGGVASKVHIHSVRTFLTTSAPMTQAPSAQPPIEAIPTSLELGAGGVEVFDSPAAREINAARLEHLAGLDLSIHGKSVLDLGCGVGHLSTFFVERGCRVVCVDARAENLERLATLYPGRETGLANVERDSLETFGRFQIVFCYGLIYHTENPIAALRNIASCCDELLLLETVVTDHSKPIVQLVDEPIATKNQAASGFGSRPSPAYIAMALSRMGFPFIYTARTTPNHPDFQLEWRKDCEWRRGDRLLRCVFIASRTKLRNAKLVSLLEAEGFVANGGHVRPTVDAPSEVWIDVGAHLGEKTFSFAERNPSARVFAFEPNLKIASRLIGRLPNYVVITKAVAEEDGNAPFYLNRFEAASSLLPFVPDGLARWIGGDVLQVEATPHVPTIRLDTFLEQFGIERVSYLKIDAQGADLSVVRSLGTRISDVDRISLEVQITNVPLYRSGSQKSDVLRFLHESGFKLVATEQQSHGQEENLTFERR
jgi:FkbM family methyltransferase